MGDFSYLIGSHDWLNPAIHPVGAVRRSCIREGITIAELLHDAAAVRLGSQDSAVQANAQQLQRMQPDLFAGRLPLTSWTIRRALELVGPTGVGEEAALVRSSVVRRPTLTSAVQTLAAAAARGSTAMRQLRGLRFPGQENYPLREDLPEPWQCTIHEEAGAETATCMYSMVGGNSEKEVRRDYKRAYRDPRSVLRAAGWREVHVSTDNDDLGSSRFVYSRHHTPDSSAATITLNAWYSPGFEGEITAQQDGRMEASGSVHLTVRVSP